MLRKDVLLGLNFFSKMKMNSSEPCTFVYRGHFVPHKCKICTFVSLETINQHGGTEKGWRS